MSGEYDHVKWFSSIWKLRLKLGSGSRLLMTTKGLTRAAGEGVAMPCHAVRHAVNAATVARIASRAAGAGERFPDQQGFASTSGCRAPVNTYETQREDS
jgi:hypothetical protein